MSSTKVAPSTWCLRPLPGPLPSQQRIFSELIILGLVSTMTASSNVFCSSPQSINRCRGQEWEEVTAHERRGEEEGEHCEGGRSLRVPRSMLRTVYPPRSSLLAIALIYMLVLNGTGFSRAPCSPCNRDNQLRPSLPRSSQTTIRC